MSASFPASEPTPTGRRSQRVALVLLGTMGVVGGVVAWDAWRRAGREPDVASTLPEAPSEPVAADRTYQNNEFVPGVGYYHAPYHSWFPFPFNHHDPSRGYFAGGLWQAVPFAAGVLSSRPNAGAVTSALSAQQHYDQEQRARAGTSGFSGARRSTFGGSSFSPRPSTAPAPRPTATPSSRPAAPSARPASAPPPSTSKPTIQRGGFGSSGKGASGSGS